MGAGAGFARATLSLSSQLRAIVIRSPAIDAARPAQPPLLTSDS
jgi:hypothetical protein